jgi:hypothetical protein
MALGTVITAKGKRLDFAELVRNARRPVAPVVEKGEVIRQVPPARELRARGHMPSHNGVAAPVVEAVDQVPYRHVENKSLADYTSITIDEAKHLKERPDDPVQSANEKLAQILNNDARRAANRRKS